MRRPSTVVRVLPRGVTAALACAGAAGGLLIAGVATLPAAAATNHVTRHVATTAQAPRADPSPSGGADPSSSGIVILPTTQAPPPTSEAAPTSSAPTHSVAPTSAAARTSHPVSSGSPHATASSVPTGTTHTSRAVTSSTTAASGGTSNTSSGGSNTTYYPPPAGLPTDLAASQGPVALVTSKAANGKAVFVPQASEAPDRKVGRFSLSSVLVTTVIAASIVAALGGIGLWLTHRFGTRLSQADQTPL